MKNRVPLLLPGQFLSLKQDKETRTFLFTGAYQRLECSLRQKTLLPSRQDGYKVSIPSIRCHGPRTALSSNKISGAAFDVFWEEPPDPNDKLLKLDNFILTPHIAGWTIESVDTTARIIATNIERLERSERKN